VPWWILLFIVILQALLQLIVQLELAGTLHSLSP
jgi:hypothetical protein